MTEPPRNSEPSAWNPGLSSTIPKDYLPLSTLHDSRNVFTSLSEVRELSDFTGLPEKELVRFRPERLIVHETLIRVMATLSVPDGSNYGDLGINFRSITDAILTRHAAPHLSEITDAYDRLLGTAREFFDRELDATVFSPPAAKPEPESRRLSPIRRLFGFGRGTEAPKPSAWAVDPLTDAITRWIAERDGTDDDEARALFDALIRTANAIAARRGRLVSDRRLFAEIALTFVCNGHGSELVGRMLEPIFQTAHRAEGFRQLPLQSKPVIMNVKGSSASGKSTLRPQQQKLAARIGVPWRDFALISPDIWRKYLLDYDSLGEAARYAGMLTGHELEIVDKKLDRYMASQAATSGIPHLLIDRFRFDSFADQARGEAGSRLLTRFGDLVYMFFMITPPEATVERAWGRGLEFGRYKAVDDLLDHNVEAYSGMPNLFFTWALNDGKKVHYEFLDNSVPKDKLPRTVAFGWNREMTVFDVKCMLDVERFSKINLGATAAEEVYRVAASMAPGDNTDFLERCARKLSRLNLADPDTGRIYAQLDDGKLTWADRETLERHRRNDDFRAGIDALIPELEGGQGQAAEGGGMLDRDSSHTLGQWSGAG